MMEKRAYSLTRTRSGFTLIELLVVIAIIAILAAILFPVFAQAKNAAKGSQSLSNVKQLATAAIMYSGDADDVFVSQYVAPPDYGWQQSWIMLSLPYIKSYGIFKDPNDNVRLTTAFPSGPKVSYVANSLLGGNCINTSGTFWKFRGVIGFNGDPNYGGANWYENGTRSQTQISQVADTVLFATRSATPPGTDHDAAAGKMEGAFSPWNAAFQGPSSTDANNGSNGTLPGQKSIWSAPDPTYKGYIDRFYSGNSPVAFTDGHAKSMKPEQTVDMGGGAADGNAGGCYDKRYLNKWDSLR
jgi:prepilin-type N-terminal cleavage/methylation domain-containing protein